MCPHCLDRHNRVSHIKIWRKFIKIDVIFLFYLLIVFQALPYFTMAIRPIKNNNNILNKWIIYYEKYVTNKILFSKRYWRELMQCSNCNERSWVGYLARNLDKLLETWRNRKFELTMRSWCSRADGMRFKRFYVKYK